MFLKTGLQISHPSKCQRGLRRHRDSRYTWISVQEPLLSSQLVCARRDNDDSQRAIFLEPLLDDLVYMIIAEAVTDHRQHFRLKNALRKMIRKSEVHVPIACAVCRKSAVAAVRRPELFPRFRAAGIEESRVRKSG